MRAQRFGHVVNIVTWGVQMRAPKFTAYIASKSALDAWSRSAARETYGDNVRFTNMRFSLVRTPMSAPTEAYAGRGATPIADQRIELAGRCSQQLKSLPHLQGRQGGLLGAQPLQHFAYHAVIQFAAAVGLVKPYLQGR